MTEEELKRRQAEVYAARDEYERLLAAYDRDTRTPTGGYMLHEMLESSQHEQTESEEEFRRGYLYGAREAVMYFYEMVREHRIAFEVAYNALYDWHERDLAHWQMAAKTDKGKQIAPPDPQVPEKRKKS